jgi:zinc/manganese transport system substrate-binding protein
MVLRHRPARSTSTAALVAGAVLLAACGSSGDGAAADGGIVATTTIWADITSHVACDAPVPAVIPAGADPHSFEPSLRDREELERASTVVANGNGLEAGLVDLLDTVAANGTNVVEMTLHVDVLDADTDHGDHADDHADDEQADDHGHGEGGDPHIWQDPTRIAGALDVIASAVATDADLDAIRACTDVYRDELVALDAEIEGILAPIPADRRVLVTNHDSLAYFADRYGFEIVGTVIPSTSTIAEASAASLAELASTIEVHDVPAIFVGGLESTADAEALADRLGVGVVTLTTDALAPEGPAASYVGMLRSNASAIADALGPP